MGDNRNRQPWTRAELDLMVEQWPKGGIRVVAPLMPYRSHVSLRGKADYLGLNIEGRKRPEKYQPSEFIDAVIRRAYQTGAPNLTSLERATGRHRGWIKWRAAAMGLSVTQGGNHAPWSAAENAMLQDGIDAGKSATAMHRALKLAGYHRSLSATASQIFKLGLSFTRDWWTANDVALMFAIDHKSIVRWLENGWLVATKERGPSAYKPASAMLWKIKPDAVRRFMLAYPEKWDHRRMNREILLDLLAPKALNRNATSLGGMAKSQGASR